MFRIYNKENECWVKNGVYISPNPHTNFYESKKSIFGLTKLKLASEGKYIFHKSIGLYDRNDKLVFEGDYVEANVSEDKTIIGLVVFAQELSSYIILCNETNEWFTLGSEVCNYIEVIGNVFDGY